MMNRSKLQAAALILTGMVALAPIQPAAAQDKPVFVYGEPEYTRTEHVSFADLDLVSSNGALKLESRVGQAVKQVCLFDNEIRIQPSDYGVCATDSWARARPQIDRAIANAEALALGGQPAAISATIAVAGR